MKVGSKARQNQTKNNIFGFYFSFLAFFFKKKFAKFPFIYESEKYPKNI